MPFKRCSTACSTVKCCANASSPSPKATGLVWSCAACRALARDLRALRGAAACAERVVVDLSAGSADAQGVMRHFRLDGLPTLAFLDADGVERWRLTGAPADATLRAKLDGAC